jgi:hypothetical protein
MAGDAPVGAYEKGLPLRQAGAKDPSGDTVGPGDRSVLVSEQRIGKSVFSGEGILLSDRIPRDTEDLGASLADLRDEIAESAGFAGSAGGVGLRVKEEDDRPAAQVRQANPSPAARG